MKDDIYIIERVEYLGHGGEFETWYSLPGLGYFTEKSKAEDKIRETAKERFNEALKEAKKNVAICKKIAGDFKDHKIEYKKTGWDLTIKFDPKHRRYADEIVTFFRHTAGSVCDKSWDEVRIHTYVDLEKEIEKALDDSFSIAPPKSIEEILKEYDVVRFVKGEV